MGRIVASERLPCIWHDAYLSHLILTETFEKEGIIAPNPTRIWTTGEQTGPVSQDAYKEESRSKARCP